MTFDEQRLPATVGPLDDCPDVVAILLELELVAHGVDNEDAIENLQDQINAITWH